MLNSLLLSWTTCAAGAPGAAVVITEDAGAAVFPQLPERSVFNNAVLDRDLDAAGVRRAIAALAALYAGAGVASYAIWVHSSDTTALAELPALGYLIDTSTRAMAMPLD